MVTNIILNCLNRGEPFHEFNDTFITLIPKVAKVQTMADFSPISLCNVVYKILSKVVVNRIKPVLQGLIGESHSAFVSYCLITDNIIITMEIFHWLSSKCCSQEDVAYALKIDMSKAYDE